MELSKLKKTWTYKEFENKLEYWVELYWFYLNEKLRKLTSDWNITDIRLYEEYKTDLAPINIRRAIENVRLSVLSSVTNYEDIMNNATWWNVFTWTLEMIEIMRKFKHLERRIELNLLSRIRNTYKMYFDLQKYLDKEYFDSFEFKSNKLRKSKKSAIWHTSVWWLAETDTSSTPKRSARWKRSKRISIEIESETQV